MFSWIHQEEEMISTKKWSHKMLTNSLSDVKTKLNFHKYQLFLNVAIMCKPLNKAVELLFPDCKFYQMLGWAGAEI